MNRIPAQSIVTGLALDVLLNRVIEKTIAAIPILGLPVIRHITVYVIKKFAAILYIEIQDHMEFKAIEVNEEMKLKAHRAALSKLELAHFAEEKE